MSISLSEFRQCQMPGEPGRKSTVPVAFHRGRQPSPRRLEIAGADIRSSGKNTRLFQSERPPARFQRRVQDVDLRGEVGLIVSGVKPRLQHEQPRQKGPGLDPLPVQRIHGPPGPCLGHIVFR